MKRTFSRIKQGGQLSPLSFVLGVIIGAAAIVFALWMHRRMYPKE